MQVGIGLPGHVRGIEGRTLVEWMRRAEARGFSTVSVSDRLVWSTPDPIATLSAAAGATSSVKLLTSVLIAPLNANHALFAKQTATLDQLAGPNRLELGLAPGLRDDDFEESDVDFSTRGKQLDSLIDRITQVWSGETGIGPLPATPGGPKLFFGGMSNAAVRRIVTHGAGWIAGDATVGDIEGFAPGLQSAWTAAGRAGTPEITASVMYALGPDADKEMLQALSAYYAFGGQEYIDYGIGIAHTSAASIKSAVSDFERAGVNRVIFMGNDSHPDQVDMLADVLGEHLQPTIALPA